MKSLPYHEQKDIENVKKLREIIKELPPSVLIISVELNHALLPEPALPMLMI